MSLTSFPQPLLKICSRNVFNTFSFYSNTNTTTTIILLLLPLLRLSMEIQKLYQNRDYNNIDLFYLPLSISIDSDVSISLSRRGSERYSSTTVTLFFRLIKSFLGFSIIFRALQHKDRFVIN